MSAAAQIHLTGESKENLLKRIQEIEDWDSGHNNDIIVTIKESTHPTYPSEPYVYDKIKTIKAIIENDAINVYIEDKFKIDLDGRPDPPKGQVWKTNGKGEDILVDDPDYFNEEGHIIKRRNAMTHLTPKKKKRKKHKR